MLIQLLTFNTLVSVKEAKKVGINRVMRIVSELRKKGWNIKTYVIMRDGKKEDIIYVNIEEMSNVGLETYVVK
jgi:carbamoylphosphate synthase large subunit